MKNSVLGLSKFFVLALIACGANAKAQQAASYNLTSAIIVEKCTTSSANGDSATTCQQDPSSVINQNQTISMPCSAVNDGVQCSGTWNGSVTVEGTAYSASVTVLQVMDSTGKVTATDVIAGISNSNSALSVAPLNGSLTDLSFMLGSGIQSTTDSTVSYILGVAVAPANLPVNNIHRAIAVKLAR